MVNLPSNSRMNGPSDAEALLSLALPRSSAERRTVQFAVVGQNLFPEHRHHGLQAGRPRFDDFAREHVGIDQQRAAFTQPPRH